MSIFISKTTRVIGCCSCCWSCQRVCCRSYRRAFAQLRRLLLVLSSRLIVLYSYKKGGSSAFASRSRRTLAGCPTVCGRVMVFPRLSEWRFRQNKGSEPSNAEKNRPHLRIVSPRPSSTSEHARRRSVTRALPLEKNLTSLLVALRPRSKVQRPAKLTELSVKLGNVENIRSK